MAILSCLLAVGGLTAGAYREDEDADSAGRGAGSGHGADRADGWTGTTVGALWTRAGPVGVRMLGATRYKLHASELESFKA